MTMTELLTSAERAWGEFGLLPASFLVFSILYFALEFMDRFLTMVERTPGYLVRVGRKIEQKLKSSR